MKNSSARSTTWGRSRKPRGRLWIKIALTAFLSRSHSVNIQILCLMNHHNLIIGTLNTLSLITILTISSVSIMKKERILRNTLIQKNAEKSISIKSISKQTIFSFKGLLSKVERFISIVSLAIIQIRYHLNLLRMMTQLSRKIQGTRRVTRSPYTLLSWDSAQNRETFSEVNIPRCPLPK